MIEITKINGEKIFINPHLIESIGGVSDTMIQYNGKTLSVRDTIDSILDKIIVYRRKIGISISDIENKGKESYINEV